MNKYGINEDETYYENLLSLFYFGLGGDGIPAFFSKNKILDRHQIFITPSLQLLNNETIESFV